MINGKNYDWESIEIMTPGGLAIGAQSISYKDSAKVENVYGKGRIIRGRGRGNYEASGSLELLRPDFDALVGALGSDYLGKADFSISIHGANDGGDSFSDTIVEAVITDQDLSGSQGDAKIPVKIDFSAKKILWDGVEPVIDA